MAHDCSRVGLSREAKNEDAVIDTVVGKYDSNIAISLRHNVGFFIYRSVPRLAVIHRSMLVACSR